MDRYPYSCLERKSNGNNLTILGVNHDGETYSKFRNFYRDKISESDAVVLESGFIKLSPARMTDADLIRGLEGKDFFAPCLEQAVEECKKVFISDPRYRDKDWRKSGKRANKFNYLLFTGFLSMCIGCFEDYRLAMLLGGLMAPPGIIFGSIGTTRIAHPLLRFHYHDYRDIKIAEGLSELSENLEGKNILAIHGDWHSRGISFYFDNPKLRDAKLKVYAEYEKGSREKGTDKIRKVEERTKVLEAPSDKEIEAFDECAVMPFGVKDTYFVQTRID